MPRKSSSRTVVSRDPAVVADRILDAAEAVFMADGYAGASTNRILDLFGGSKATLFRHFATKEAMLMAVIRRIGEGMARDAGWSAVDAGWPDAPRAWLVALGRSALRTTLDPRATFVGRMVVAQGRNMPQLRETFTEVAITPMLSRLAHRFAAWHDAGVIVSAEPEADAILYFDLLLAGWISRSMFGLPPETSDAFLEREATRAADLYLDGRRPR